MSLFGFFGFCLDSRTWILEKSGCFFYDSFGEHFDDARKKKGQKRCRIRCLEMGNLIFCEEGGGKVNEVLAQYYVFIATA